MQTLFPHLSGILFLLLFGWSCSPSIPSASAPEREVSVEAPATTSPAPWAQALSARDTAALAAQYTPDAVHVTEAGEVVTGAQQIAVALLDRDLSTVDTLFTRHRITIGPDGAYHYEIGGFRTRDGRDFQHLVIRQQVEDRDRRALEMIAPVRLAPAEATAAIDRRRAEWIERCNRHDAEALIENLYTSNTIYYNHRPVIVGRAALIENYQYMNNPDYRLTLTPLAFELVNDSLAFEIGQCRGSYGGKYVLVWQRDATDTWSILLDANL